MTEAPRKKIVLDLDWLPEPLAGPHTVTFLPHRRQVQVGHGHSVFEAGKSAGEFIPTDCGGKGTCGRCRVRVEGDARAPTYVEKAFIPGRPGRQRAPGLPPARGYGYRRYGPARGDSRTPA